jgi:hypothetical protein
MRFMTEWKGLGRRRRLNFVARLLREPDRESKNQN